MPRRKGDGDIPPRKKARILAKKNVQEYTSKKIADEEGVSLSTVKQTKPENVSPAIKAMAANYEQQYLQDLKRTNYKLLAYLEEKVDDKTLPATAISTAVGVTFDKIQIKTNQPTQIIAHDVNFYVSMLNDYVTETNAPIEFLELPSN